MEIGYLQCLLLASNPHTGPDDALVAKDRYDARKTRPDLR